MRKEIDEVLQEGRFEIKVWNSNSPAVDQNPLESQVELLGHNWDKINDLIQVKWSVCTIPDPPNFTKTAAMGVVARIWDLYGMWLPVTIKYRIDLQLLWQLGYDWEEPLLDEQVEIWRANVHDLEILSKLRIRRCLQPSNTTGPPQLHAFSDGGDLAFGTCVFIRWPTPDGFEIVFVAAKAFVAPLKRKTTPRLELMGAVAMGRLVTEVLRTLSYQFEYSLFWMDSEVVMYWLNSSSLSSNPSCLCAFKNSRMLTQNGATRLGTSPVKQTQQTV